MIADCGAVILAGGQSKRMGANKALLRLGGIESTLIEIVLSRIREAGFPHPLLVTNSPGDYAFLGLRTVADERPGSGPLAGILSGLLHSGYPRIVVVACDMPLLNPALLAYMASAAPSADAVVPRWTDRDGKVCIETLHTVYSVRCVEPARRRLGSGDFRAHALFEEVSVSYVEEADLRRFDPTLDSFRNINTPEDWETLQARAK